ncbi:MAG: hypothetical protein Q8K81_08970 [Sulfuricurvum sp.]|nr:hypothetical protein [Sulfuricurvum sp.]
MKKLFTVVSISAILSTSAFSESVNMGVQMKQQMMQQENEEIQNQNRLRHMSTDELLEKRGTMINQREREQLHNELQSRSQKMTEEQKLKFNKRPPENRIPKGMGGGR